MPVLKMPDYTVIRDAREKVGHGWFFTAHDDQHKPPRCAGTVRRKLDAGDYSLEGYEDVLLIERKYGFCELWGNYGKNKRKQFEAEMRAMSEVKYAYLIVESTLNADIVNLSPPQFTKSVAGKQMLRWLFALSAENGVHIVPAGPCGAQVAQLIFESVIRLEKDKWIPAGSKNDQARF